MTIIQFNKFNYSGDIKGTKELTFDFKNNTFTIGNKTFKVEQNSEFTFKILKTKIKAIDGIEGFYNFVSRCNDTKSPFNGSFYNMLDKLEV